MANKRKNKRAAPKAPKPRHLGEAALRSVEVPAGSKKHIYDLPSIERSAAEATRAAKKAVRVSSQEDLPPEVAQAFSKASREPGFRQQPAMTVARVLLDEQSRHAEVIFGDAEPHTMTQIHEKGGTMQPVDAAGLVQAGTMTEQYPGLLSSSEVLDMHADLHQLLAKPYPLLRRALLEYARADVASDPQWAPSHLHPATNLNNLEPWLASLATDLAGATTYQVTAEMSELAAALVEKRTPGVAELRTQDLPSPSGFMWLDKAVARPSVEDSEEFPALLMHAVSWIRIPEMTVVVAGAPGEDNRVIGLPGIRIREWGYTSELSVFPKPLYLMGQATCPVGSAVIQGQQRRIATPRLELWWLHMVWVLMGMEIVSTAPHQVSRQARRRAVRASLKQNEVRVVLLRRVEHHEEGGYREVAWACRWVVQGHDRHLDPYTEEKHHAVPDGPDKLCAICGGRTTWVRPYLKGPDGMPLKVSRTLYKLAR